MPERGKVMTRLHYYSGLKVIGGTVVEIETDTTRCFFDFGFTVNDTIDKKVEVREGHVLSDYLRLKMVPMVDGIYAKEDLEQIPLRSFEEEKKKVFFIISHMHIDHCEGLGLLAPEIPVYMTEESKKMYFALHEAKQEFFRHHENVVAIKKETPVMIGDITIEAIPVDHDIVGATGFFITTQDGTIAYTGDYRLHGFHPEKTLHFAERANGVDVCITEGVSVSFIENDLDHIIEDQYPPRMESELDYAFAEACRKDKGMIIINPYERNVERVYQLLKTAKEEGRTLILEPLQVQLLLQYYPDESYLVWKELCENSDRDYVKEIQRKKNVMTITTEEICEKPEKYVIQLLYEHSYFLFDLPIEGQNYYHMDGSPLGDYDPSYEKIQALLEDVGMNFVRMGTGGHSSPMALKETLTRMEPHIITPLHSFRPEHVTCAPAQQILPKADVIYRLLNHQLIEE